MFQATQQSRRVICSRGQNGAQRCRLRIDKAMQFRRVSYGRAVQFIQSEQYLKRDEVDRRVKEDTEAYSSKFSEECRNICTAVSPIDYRKNNSHT